MTTVELTVHFRARPAPGWLAYRTSTRNVSAGYFEEDAELWDSAGHLVAQSRQLALALA
jgi:acyl-CoA thioesterase